MSTFADHVRDIVRTVLVTAKAFARPAARKASSVRHAIDLAAHSALGLATRQQLVWKKMGIAPLATLATLARSAPRDAIRSASLAFKTTQLHASLAMTCCQKYCKKRKS